MRVVFRLLTTHDSRLTIHDSRSLPVPQFPILSRGVLTNSTTQQLPNSTFLKDSRLTVLTNSTFFPGVPFPIPQFHSSTIPHFYMTHDSRLTVFNRLTTHGPYQLNNSTTPQLNNGSFHPHLVLNSTKTIYSSIICLKNPFNSSPISLRFKAKAILAFKNPILSPTPKYLP